MPGQVCPPRWKGLLRGVPAGDVPLGSVVTVVAKGEVIVSAPNRELLDVNAFGIVFAFVGGEVEIHVYERESSKEPKTVLPVKKGAEVHWKDSARGVLSIASRGEEVCCLELGLSASSWFAGLSQVLKGVVCDESVTSIMEKCSLPPSLAPSLARHGFESLRFLRNASSKDLKAAGLSSSQAKAVMSEARRTPLASEVDLGSTASSVLKPVLLEEAIPQGSTSFREDFAPTKLQQIEPELEREVQCTSPSGREAVSFFKEHREVAKERIAALLKLQGKNEAEAEQVLEQHSGPVSDLINNLAAKAASLPDGVILPPVLSLTYPARPDLAGDYLLSEGQERHGMPVWKNSKGGLLATHESGRWAVHVGEDAADRGVAILISDEHYGAFPQVPGISWNCATPEGWLAVKDYSITAAADSDRSSDRNPSLGRLSSRGSEGRIVEDEIVPVRQSATSASSVAAPPSAEELAEPPSPMPDVLEAVPAAPQETLLPSPPPALLPHLRKVIDLHTTKGWKTETKEKHKGAVILWESLPVSWTKMHAGRFSTVVECSMATLVKFIENPENMKLWDKSLQKVEILEDIEQEGAINMVAYMAMRIPPIQGRDWVAFTSSCLLTPEEAYEAGLVASVAEGGVSGEKFHRTGGAKMRGDEFQNMEDLAGNVFMIGSIGQASHPREPVTKNKYVRAEVYSIGIFAIPISPMRTKVILLASVDPGGKLPAWAVNIAQRDQINKLKALKNIIDGKQYDPVSGKLK